MALIGDWTVIFEFNRQPMRLNTPFEEQWDFDKLKEGFWLDAQRQIVHEPRGVFWIPPSRIMMIEKRK